MRTLEQIRKEAADVGQAIAALRKELANKEKRHADLVREAGKAARAEIAATVKGNGKGKKDGVIDATYEGADGTHQ
jgi:cell division septum initiation protein DivIVA